MKNPILCKILILRIFWRLTLHTLSTWHPHIIFPNILLPLFGTLVDRGANGSLVGADVHILERSGRKVPVTGIDDHELPGLDIVTCVALIQTNLGKVNMLMHEYAYYGRGNTIHSPCQIEWFNNSCDDKSHHVGGKQVITFLDGYATPLCYRSGHMLGKPTDKDLDQYPHVLLTSPCVYWIIPILIHVDIPHGHLILLLGTNMTQE